MRTQTIRFIFLLLICQSIVAEELSEDEKALQQLYGGSEMISIATGRKQPIHKAPSVTTLITSEDIKSIGATDLDDVLETVPGLHVARGDTTSYNSIYTFRGIYSGLNPQVLVLINGIPVTNVYQGDRNLVWGGMPIQAISRIEVVRGPGSALYGADAFAGVINIITKTKQDINGSEVGGRAGSYNTWDGWALHGGTWAGFDVAAAVEYHDTAGQRGLIESDTQTGIDKALGTHASLAPGPVNLSRESLDVRLDLSRDHWRLRGGLQRRDHVGTGTGIAHALDPMTYGASDRWNADLTYDNPDFTDHWDVKAQLSYLDTSQIEGGGPLRIFPAGTTLPISPKTGQIDFSPTSTLVNFPNGYLGDPAAYERHARSNISASFDGFEDHLLRLGGGYNYSLLYNPDEIKNFGLDPVTGIPIPFLPGIPLVNVSNTSAAYMQSKDRHNFFFFAQDEWKFSRDWLLTGGLRYDNFSDFGSTLNPRAAIIWETRQDLTSKIMYGSAFRPPSFAELYNMNNPVVLGNTNLKPETIDTLEMAFDYRPIDKLRFGFNVFYYWWKDKLAYVQDVSGAFAMAQNTGSQEGYGGEFESEWQFSDTLKLLGNYAYQNSTNMATHTDAGNSPHHQVYFRTNWEFMPDWSASPQVKWISSRQRLVGDTRPSLEGYALLDFTLRRKLIKDHWEVAFSVRNLANTNAREPSSPSTPNDLPLAGRNFYGQISYHF